MNKKASFSTIALLIIFGASGCGTMENQNTEKSSKDSYMQQLDALQNSGATGNLLSCMYILKANSFLSSKNADELTKDTDLRNAFSEAQLRAKANATGKLSQILGTGVGNQFEFCDSLGEIDYNTFEYKDVESLNSKVNKSSGSTVWQHSLDMTGIGVWQERLKSDWQEDVGQQYLFINNVNCLFYVFDENAQDKDLMRKAYQWLSQYSGVHIAGSNWLLMDSSYGEKCTGPITDVFGGYRVN
jgi:hypothetical protein